MDVQPHYFPGLLPHVDLVIDDHPEQSGYNAIFKDIRPTTDRRRRSSPSTCARRHGHLERTATAMLYAIKSDTAVLPRHANRADIEAFSYFYPLGDATRSEDGRRGITGERLDYLIKAWQQGRMMGALFCAFLGGLPREDFIPTSRLLPAARERAVDGDQRRRQRSVRGVGARTWLLAQRRGLRAALVRRDRQRRRPSHDGQGGRPASKHSRRSSAPTKAAASTSACSISCSNSCTKQGEQRQPVSRRPF